MNSEEEIFELFVEVLASEDAVPEVCGGILDHVDDDTPKVWEDDDDIPTALAKANGSNTGTGILEGSTGSW